jgi:hypothetical protein
MMIRLAALSLAGLTLGACATTVGGLPVRNTPSDLAQCPDLSGLYQSQGEIISRQGKPTAEPDLNALFARPLAVRDLSQSPDLWRDGTPTTVALSQQDGVWRIVADNGRGANVEVACRF